MPLGFSYESIVKDQARWFLQENLRNTLRNRLVEFLKKLRNETSWKMTLFLINHTECILSSKAVSRHHITRVSNSIRSLRTNRIHILIRIQYSDSNLIRTRGKLLMIERFCVLIGGFTWASDEFKLKFLSSVSIKSKLMRNFRKLKGFVFWMATSWNSSQEWITTVIMGLK